MPKNKGIRDEQHTLMEVFLVSATFVGSEDPNHESVQWPDLTDA